MVTLTGYEANQLTYDVQSAKGGVVVFSEIYYPGWTCTIDGEKADIARADYVLRAIRVPAGKHKVILTFKPQSERVTEIIAYSALCLLALILIGLLVRLIATSRTKKE